MFPLERKFNSKNRNFLNSKKMLIDISFFFELICFQALPVSCPVKLLTTAEIIQAGWYWKASVISSVQTSQKYILSQSGPYFRWIDEWTSKFQTSQLQLWKSSGTSWIRTHDPTNMGPLLWPLTRPGPDIKHNFYHKFTLHWYLGILIGGKFVRVNQSSTKLSIASLKDRPKVSVLSSIILKSQRK